MVWKGRETHQAESLDYLSAGESIEMRGIKQIYLLRVDIVLGTMDFRFSDHEIHHLPTRCVLSIPVIEQS